MPKHKRNRFFRKCIIVLQHIVGLLKNALPSGKGSPTVVPYEGQNAMNLALGHPHSMVTQKMSDSKNVTFELQRKMSRNENTQT